MPISQCTRDAHDLMEGLVQKKINHTDVKERARLIVSDDTDTSQKLDCWRQALDAYCAESTQTNLAATANILRTFPGFRELMIEKARALGF